MARRFNRITFSEGWFVIYNTRCKLSKKFNKEKNNKIEKTVEALIKHEAITEEIAVKIIDIAPENPATLKTILAKDRIEISEEEAASILKEIN